MTKRGAVVLVALAAALPAQALENGRRAGPSGRAPTCYSGGAAADPGDESRPVFIPGLGTATGLVPDTADQTAARWFEQGLLLVWAYDEAEALRAFAEAHKADPNCALCYWGEALARSPTINLQPPNVDLHAAAAAAATAARLAVGKTRGRIPGPKLDRIQQGLVDAINIRAPQSGESFDFDGYVHAMTLLAAEQAQSDAVLTLAADSELVRWSATGVALQGAQAWLETVLKPTRSPNYSGAIHFYIHLADTVAQPGIALDAARRLATLAPAASHLIHMPSHSFYGTGFYADAVTANRGAIAAYDRFEKRAPAVSGYRRYLLAHDHHYAIQAALMHGDRQGALGMARDFARRFPVQDPLFRIRPAHFAAPWYAFARQAPVDQVLAMTEPMLGESDAARGLNRVMWHYARGEAFARQPASVGSNAAASVAREASAIAALLAGPVGRALDPESEGLAQIAQHVLEGRAAMMAGRYSEAQAAYRLAMNLRFDDQLAFDPPPFWYGVRRSLAAAMLAGGDPDGAERQIKALFVTWPNEPLGLLVLSRVAAARGDPRTAKAILDEAQRLWAGGDLSEVPLPVV